MNYWQENTFLLSNQHKKPLFYKINSQYILKLLKVTVSISYINSQNSEENVTF